VASQRSALYLLWNVPPSQNAQATSHLGHINVRTVTVMRRHTEPMGFYTQENVYPSQTTSVEQ
jgi:hypothetical protein